MAKNDKIKGFLENGMEVASAAAGGAIGLAAAGPGGAALGGAVGSAGPLMISMFKNIVRKTDEEINSRYFVIKTSSMYEDLKLTIETILNNKKLRTKYNYNPENVKVEVYEFYWNDETKSFLENIDNCLSITFTDDMTNDEEEPYYSVNFLFEEELKQINFNDMQVYSACSIHTTFGIDDTRIRNYHLFSEDIENALCKGV